jgi:hypothetical protein
MSDNPQIDSPFAPANKPRYTVSLAMLLMSMFVFAALSMLIMFAARVPIIANTIHDFFGLPLSPKPDKPDRTSHLVFLLFCYTSPLLLATWVGLMHSAGKYLASLRERSQQDSESNNPLA